MDVTRRSRADAPTIADMPRAAKKTTAPMDRKTTTTTQTFTDADAALKHATALYDDGIRRLRKSLQAFISGRQFHSRVREVYPSVRVRTQTVARSDSRLSYGFVAGPGVYETSLTRPDLFGDYYREQFSLLLRNHRVALEVGPSTEAIPVHFSLADTDHLEGSLSAERRLLMRDLFDLPDLAAMDDGIANGMHEPREGQPRPLSLFTAQRVDYSLHRLRHYTGTAPEHFQNFVLFTNYQFYIDEFIRLGREQMAGKKSDYTAFVEPGNVVTRRTGTKPMPGDELGSAPARLPQMPAYHLLRPDRSGITMINIGVGPANAKNISDHVAVLRPHAWLMLGHCAGLRNTQQLGDYVLAHGYVREDHVLDEELPLWVPIPPLAEIQQALEQAVADVTQLKGYELKRVLRTGTVASTDNRNWELLPHPGPERRFSQSRAIAVDMESAAISANGFRFRVPYGTLLCVSDKPLHGEIKLPGMANHFYRERVDQHLRIGMRAVELLRRLRQDQLHSRKLRSFAEVAFQ
jgi:AMP nucleosidase